MRKLYSLLLALLVCSSQQVRPVNSDTIWTSLGVAAWGLLAVNTVFMAKMIINSRRANPGLNASSNVSEAQRAVAALLPKLGEGDIGTRVNSAEEIIRALHNFATHQADSLRMLEQGVTTNQENQKALKRALEQEAHARTVLQKYHEAFLEKMDLKHAGLKDQIMASITSFEDGVDGMLVGTPRLERTPGRAAALTQSAGAAAASEPVSPSGSFHSAGGE